jgi:hypothetical protein
MSGIDLKLFKMINVDRQSGVAIENYNGMVSLVAADSTDRGIFKKWVFPQRRVDGQNVPSEKSMPLKVEIGKGKDQAIATLKMFIACLEGNFQEQAPKQQSELMEDPNIPF